MNQIPEDFSISKPESKIRKQLSEILTRTNTQGTSYESLWNIFRLNIEKLVEDEKATHWNTSVLIKNMIWEENIAAELQSIYPDPITIQRWSNWIVAVRYTDIYHTPCPDIYTLSLDKFARLDIEKYWSASQCKVVDGLLVWSHHKWWLPSRYQTYIYLRDGEVCIDE